MIWADYAALTNGMQLVKALFCFLGSYTKTVVDSSLSLKTFRSQSCRVSCPPTLVMRYVEREGGPAEPRHLHFQAGMNWVYD